MSTAENGVLRLQGALTVEQVGALWRAQLGGPLPQEIDLTAVNSVDSAGIALLLALGDEAERRGQPRPGLRGLPRRYHDLCRAHRITIGNTHD